MSNKNSDRPLKYLSISTLENRAIAMQCCVAPIKAIASLILDRCFRE
ncbi:MAG: hypothetical protein HY785_00360 [Oscillatoriophycideae cyanobacterium NC_groundwater_1537_Pr4_S-0.65um_50_18]|nr:hypothetical protein [Oscillatoriophycideae cyanobacterium NC_groundwater_1537_Pr4_S-0.65um_50_18]